MEFRLLGPIEVILDGEPVQLGGRQRRTVLSILLVHAGESVSTERLIDELWGDSPPETARKTVQAHIAHLRRSLNVAGEVLAATDNGYTVRADSIDVRRFEEMVEAARSHRFEDPERSVGVLQDALDLFRGAPIAGLTEHVAPVWDIEFTSDGSRFVTASLDSTVTLWDTTTFELIRRLEGHTGQVFELDVDPTRPEVATASDDGTVKIWDLDTGVVRLTLPGRGAVSVAYGPDGRYLATAGVEGRVDVFILDVDELAEVAQSRPTRWWTGAECVQYLGTTECPLSPPDL